MLVASVSGSFTDQVAHHGLYAVFGLMAIDAVFPAFSELVMLYAGAVAAGVFPAAHGVALFGWHIGFGAGAFVALALAGTLGYLAGALVGWGIGAYGGRPLLERRGRWFHLPPERLDRAVRRELHLTLVGDAGHEDLRPGDLPRDGAGGQRDDRGDRDEDDQTAQHPPRARVAAWRSAVSSRL